MGDDDVLITEHRYSPEYDQTKMSGKYCVQFMTFKNTPNGLNILKWWRNACLVWCYARVENGKFGDQKYLDDWTNRFEGVHELKHLGGGVAPWNLQQYDFVCEGEKIWGIELKTGEKFPLVFFHFHGLECFNIYPLREFVLLPEVYDLPFSAKKLIYNSYLPTLKRCYHQIKKADSSVNALAIKLSSIGLEWKAIAKRLVKTVLSMETHYSYWIGL